MRKKLTELEVYRFNFSLRLWFKCGSVEEAEAMQRQREDELERLRRARDEAERAHAEAERLRVAREEAERERAREAEHKKREEVERLKAEAEQAGHDRLRRPAPGWHDFLPEELKPYVLQFFRGRLADGQTLDDLPAGVVESYTRRGQAYCLEVFELWAKRNAHRMAEAVLVAD